MIPENEKLPPGRFGLRAAKNIKVGDWVDLSFQYGFIEYCYSKVIKITNHRDGTITIVVDKREGWDWQNKLSERSWTFGRQQMVQKWIPDDKN